MHLRRSIAAVLLVAVVALGACSSGGSDTPTANTRKPGQALSNPGARTLDAYKGLGAWVDVFDYMPNFQNPGTLPEVTPANVDDMARLGVATLYLHASRDDSKSPGGLTDPDLLSEFVRRAHKQGIRVVAWYAPRLVDIDVDFAKIKAMDDFRVDGHGFDGIALDIEAVDNEDVIARNEALITLSKRVRAEVKGTLGAIVLPTVQIEVVSQTYWPMFPWAQIAKSYDVWLPMAYATFRKDPYRDHVRYIDESVQRMRANLKDKNAPVHVIGGLADKMNADDFIAVRQSAIDTKALGWSVYDYAITPTTAWAPLRDGVSSEK